MKSEVMLIADAVTVLFLAAALVYGVRLNASIEAFLKSRSEWAAVFRGFDSAVSQAQTHLRKLSEEASLSAAELQKRVDEARLIAEDLRHATDRAERTLDVALLKTKRPEEPAVRAPGVGVPLREFAAPSRGFNLGAKPSAGAVLPESARASAPAPRAETAVKRMNDEQRRQQDAEDERAKKQKIFERMLERAAGKMYPPTSPSVSGGEAPPETLRRALAALRRGDDPS